MTTPLPPEAHALVLLGEVRGDVKGIGRAIVDLTERMAAQDAARGIEIDKLSARVSSLESYRTKIAGFTIALALFLTFTKDKLPALATFITGGL